jgi:putative endonuclease
MLTWIYRGIDRARQRAQRRLLAPDLATGHRGEDIAHRYLQRRGYRVVARNFRPRSGVGEIDLIAWDRETLVIVEVKTRRSDEFGLPERNVTPEKEQSLVRAARDYARRAGVDWEKVRFDLISIVLREPPAVVHQEAAFRSTPRGRG